MTKTRDDLSDELGVGATVIRKTLAFWFCGEAECVGLDIPFAEELGNISLAEE